MFYKIETHVTMVNALLFFFMAALSWLLIRRCFSIVISTWVSDYSIYQSGIIIISVFSTVTHLPNNVYLKWFHIPFK